MLNLNKSREFFDPTDFHDRIHIIGCGSVGSTLAENLARFGFTKFSLYDFDTVEDKNLVNQMFVEADIGKLKVDAVRRILTDINPDIAEELELYPQGYTAEPLDGYVFLCVDSIELRRKIVESNMGNSFIQAMFDFRTRLFDAQHFACAWNDYRQRKNFLASMQFTTEEAAAETPVSACGTALSVCPTIRIIVGYGVTNFINFVMDKPIKTMILADAFNYSVTAV